MFGTGRVVKIGTFLYAGEVTCDVCIEQTAVRWGSGDYEDPPEIRDDMEGQWYYIWYSPAGSRGDFKVGGPVFASLEEAVQHVESTLDSVQWAGRP